MNILFIDNIMLKPIIIIYFSAYFYKKPCKTPVNPKIFTYIQTANVCFLNSTGLILLSPVLIRTLL